MSEEDKAKLGEDEIDMREQYFNAWVHTLEMPIASSVSPVILFEVATAFLKSFREQTDKMLQQSLHEETAEDLVANAEAEQQAELLDAMAANIKE